MYAASAHSTSFLTRLLSACKVPLVCFFMLLFTLGPLLTMPSVAHAQNPPAKENPAIPVQPLSTEAAGWVASLFYLLFVQLTGLITYLGGVMFDYATSIALQSATYADEAINRGWTIARDIANMLFVFLLVYLAFQVMLNLEGVGVGKKLAMLIMVALLINFSFFFTRVIIDTSNLFAHQFYDRIRGRTTSVPQIKVGVEEKPLQVKSVSENIIASVNPQGVLSNESFKQFQSSAGFLTNVAVLVGLFFGFGMVNLILAFLFFTAAIQFIKRIVALWFAIMLAPIGFIAFALPGTLSGFTKTWWQTLLSNAIFAPVFLFLLYVIIIFMQGGILGSGFSAASLYGNASTVEAFFRPIVMVFVRLAIVIGLLLAALKVVEQVSDSGSKSILAGAGRFAGSLGSMSSGAIGLGGRQVFGRAAGYAAQGAQAAGWNQKERSVLARTSFGALNKMSQATYDPHNAPAAISNVVANLAKVPTVRVDAAVSGANAASTRAAAPAPAAAAAPTPTVVVDTPNATVNAAGAQISTDMVRAMQDVGEQLKATATILAGNAKDGNLRADERVKASQANKVQAQLVAEQEEQARQQEEAKALRVANTGFGSGALEQLQALEDARRAKEESDTELMDGIMSVNLGAPPRSSAPKQTTPLPSQPQTSPAPAPTLQQQGDGRIAQSTRGINDNNVANIEQKRAELRGTEKRIDEGRSVPPIAAE